LKFTEDGHVEIRVEIIKNLLGEEFLVIDVIDSGIGIKAEDRDKLFKLFGFVQDSK
jgi:signal transduction histidine kinase